MTVYVLIAFYTTIASVNPVTLQKVTDLHIETAVFQTADRCLKNRDANLTKLLENKKLEDVSVECVRRELIMDEAKMLRSGDDAK